MLRKISMPLAGMLMIFGASAQDSAKVAPALTISGSADVYYKYDFKKNGDNSLTSFTPANDQFALGMASVKFDYKKSKTEIVADLGFGDRAKAFAYNDDGIVQAIKQLYISYSINSTVKLTAGTWGTHVGYEVLDPQLNRNYSMSYMFTNGPFSHTGFKADFTFGKSGLMVGIANPTDYRSVPNGVGAKNVIAQYSYAASDKFKGYLNFVGGKDISENKSAQVDLTITSKLSDLFSLGYNGTINTSKAYDATTDKYSSSRKWFGSALYVNLDPKPYLGFTFRGEYFNDKDAVKLGAGGNIFAATLSANIKVDGLTFIPEIRFDNSSEENFVDKNGLGKKSAANFLLAAVYSF